MGNNKDVKAPAMGTTYQPIAKAEMLIRRPVAEVFEAFINPTITSKFWFTKASGRLEPGKLTVQMPLAKTFFSPRFGMVSDRFGASWMILVTTGQTGAKQN